MLLTARQFLSTNQPSAEDPALARWFVVQDGRLLVSSGQVPALASPDVALALLPSGCTHCFGRLDARDCMLLAVDTSVDAPPGHRWEGLRSLFPLLSDELLALAGRATQIAEWDRSHRYCGRCAMPTVERKDERVRVCPGCGHTAYPRVSPCMMVLIRRDREILLARAAHHPPGMFSALAGFVEPGESLEETVRREVREEVNLEIDGLRYFASQSWPFPHQLMVAFHARFAGGELKIDPSELVDAAWFPVERLPKLPTPVSVARQLIEAAVAELGPAS